MLAVLAIAAQAADPAYAAAVEARTSGRTAEAIAAFEELSRARPADADVWLNLGLAYTADQRFDEADRALATALSLAPDYADARIAYARTAYFRGDLPAAKTRLAPVSASNTDARGLQRQIEAAEGPAEAAWRLDVAYARSELTDNLGHWTLASAALGRRFSNGSAAIAVEQTERFGFDDTYVEATAARSFQNGGAAWLAVGGAPDADYRPEFSLRAGGEIAAHRSGPWAVRLGADASWQRFPVGEVRSLQPYVALSWGDRATVTLRSYNTLDERDEYRAGYSVRGEWSALPQLRLSLGWADAPESDSGRTVVVQAVSAGVGLDINDVTTLQAAYTHEMRDAYDRDELAVALTRRF